MFSPPHAIDFINPRFGPWISSTAESKKKHQKLATVGGKFGYYFLTQPA
jgi:hypothetical protein